jgi:aminoglycoside 2''-phosphotransferase
MSASVQGTSSVLASRVRSAFPDLEFAAAELIEAGEDHLVLVLDGRLVFRFPRHAGHPTGLARERAVLGALKGRCDLAIPDYRYVAPTGDFAGYPLIVGDELTPDRFAALKASAQETALEQIAGFLTAMHSLDLAAVAAGDDARGWPRDGTPADYAADGRARRLPPIRAAFPGLAGDIEAFYDRLAARAPGPTRLIHSDLTADHILLAPAGDRLAGVIDFGDTELGDPAQDFAHLWSYGEAAFSHVWSGYGRRDIDPGLPERSRWNFASYSISRLAEALDEGEDASAPAAALPAILAAL